MHCCVLSIVLFSPLILSPQTKVPELHRWNYKHDALTIMKKEKKTPRNPKNAQCKLKAQD